jgi:Na+-transporting methylmalonyl-CoA/oxaloacetate decarboxylase gamma subunit
VSFMQPAKFILICVMWGVSAFQGSSVREFLLGDRNAAFSWRIARPYQLLKT